MPRVALSRDSAPAALVHAAGQLGSNIRIARKRRQLRQRELARMAGITIATLQRVEAGELGTGVGAYIAALWALGMQDGIARLAAPDTDLEGQTLEAARRGERVRPRATLSNDF
jgi:transcriptional regulator with XRE-family HTH domain